MLFSEFKSKEVINLHDCKRLGKICNFEFDECTGQIQKLIVPSNSKIYNLLCPAKDYIFSYKEIRQIGPDIIIVDLHCNS